MNDRQHIPTANLRRPIYLWALVFVIAVLALTQLACSTCGPLQQLASAATSTPTQIAAAHTPTATSSPTNLPPLPTRTTTPTNTPSSTHTPRPTNTPPATFTPVPTNTPRPINTPAPTNTLAATNTPVPAGFIFEDDFSTDKKVWVLADAENWTTELKDNRMHFTVKIPKRIVWNVIGRDLTDVKFGAVAYPQPGVAGYNYGLVFREQNNNSLYLARVSVSGRYALHKYVDGEPSVVIDWTETGAIQAGENTLLLVCVGSRFDFYVNDTLLFSQTDDSLAHGDIGVYVATGDEPGAQVHFGYFLAFEATDSDLVQVQATPTPAYTWADYLYFDLVRTRDEYVIISGWYTTLSSGGSVNCPAQDYALHRPSYVVPESLPALRAIYDQYIAAVGMVDGSGEHIGPLDRVQLLCREGKNIGQADMDFDKMKLAEAGTILNSLIEQVTALR